MLSILPTFLDGIILSVESTKTEQNQKYLINHGTGRFENSI